MNSRDKRIAIQKGESVRPMSEQKLKGDLAKGLRAMSVRVYEYDGGRNLSDAEATTIIDAVLPIIRDYVRQQSAPDDTGLAELAKRMHEKGQRKGRNQFERGYLHAQRKFALELDALPLVDLSMARNEVTVGRADDALLELAIEMGYAWRRGLIDKPTPADVQKRYKE